MVVMGGGTDVEGIFPIPAAQYRQQRIAPRTDATMPAVRYGHPSPTLTLTLILTLLTGANPRGTKGFIPPNCQNWT